jgi:hypothetical protein
MAYITINITLLLHNDVIRCLVAQAQLFELITKHPSVRSVSPIGASLHTLPVPPVL